MTLEASDIVSSRRLSDVQICAYFRIYASPKSEKGTRGTGEKLESLRNFHAEPRVMKE